MTFTLRDIKITGAKTIPADAFRPLYAKLIGQTIKLSNILDVADAIEQMYRDKGYILVRAYVPPQRVRDGVFTINVVEGKIAHVTVEGGTPATQAQVKAYVQPSLDRSPMPLAVMERSLLLSNDLPGVVASGVLKPSEDIPGASDIAVTLDQPRVHRRPGRGQSRFALLRPLDPERRCRGQLHPGFRRPVGRHLHHVARRQ